MTTETKTDTLKCPECKSDQIRAQVAETCRVEFDEQGEVLSCWDFLNDGIDETTLYCEGCGENLSLTYNDGKYYELEKRI